MYGRMKKCKYTLKKLRILCMKGCDKVVMRDNVSNSSARKKKKKKKRKVEIKRRSRVGGE